MNRETYRAHFETAPHTLRPAQRHALQSPHILKAYLSQRADHLQCLLAFHLSGTACDSQLGGSGDARPLSGCGSHQLATGSPVYQKLCLVGGAATSSSSIFSASSTSNRSLGGFHGSRALARECLDTLEACRALRSWQSNYRHGFRTPS